MPAQRWQYLNQYCKRPLSVVRDSLCNKKYPALESSACVPIHLAVDLQVPGETHPRHESDICAEYCRDSGPGSSVGIATDYGLDGPGSSPGGDEIFRP